MKLSQVCILCLCVLIATQSYAVAVTNAPRQFNDNSLLRNKGPLGLLFGGVAAGLGSILSACYWGMPKIVYTDYFRCNQGISPVGRCCHFNESTTVCGAPIGEPGSIRHRKDPSVCPDTPDYAIRCFAHVNTTTVIEYPAAGEEDTNSYYPKTVSLFVFGGIFTAIGIFGSCGWYAHNEDVYRAYKLKNPI
jgi:hypothetical protein